MMRRFLPLLACLLVAGCGGGGNESSGGSNNAAGSGSGSSASSQQQVTISETEFALTPSAVDIAQPGTVTFKVTNDGQVAHALEIEGNGVEEETDHIQPGDSAALTVKLKAGDYELYCPVDGHEDKGMKGTIRVGGPTSPHTGVGGSTTTNEGTTTSDDDDPGY